MTSILETRTLSSWKSTFLKTFVVADGVGAVLRVATAVAEEVALADAVDVLVEMADAVAEDEADRVMVEVLVAGSNGKKATDTLMSEGD